MERASMRVLYIYIHTPAYTVRLLSGSMDKKRNCYFSRSSSLCFCFSRFPAWAYSSLDLRLFGSYQGIVTSNSPTPSVGECRAYGVSNPFAE